MPLYDFACDDCGGTCTLLMKYEDRALCPACGSAAMTRQMAPCAVTGLAKPAGASAAAPARTAPTHTHSAACGCGSPSTQVKASCPTQAIADKLIKKYLA